MAEPDELDGQRLVGGGADATERAAEAALRPKRLEDFTGQEVVRGQLSVVLRSALARGVTADHVLLSGPPGLGKTTLAMIIAAEVDGSLRLTSGPAIQHAGDLAAILSSLEEGDVLFIDEIHRLARTAEEMLYLAMEDFRVDIVVGKGPGATSIPLSLPPFTVVGATTRAGLLPAPLRDRFGFTGHLDYYGPGELTRILTRSAGLLGVNLEADAAKELASRSRGTPRIANRLLRRVQDWAEVHGRPGRLDLAAVYPVRWRPGGADDAGGQRGGGARDGGDCGRALPGARRARGAHPAGAGRHAGCLQPPGTRAPCRRIIVLLSDDRVM